MLVDVNILLHSVHRASAHRERAASWLSEQLNGDGRVGLPWPCLTAFVRVATHPRAFERPLTSRAAWSLVEEWLGADAAWIPLPTERHAQILGNLITTYDLTGKLIPDADLAALAIEHGLEICSMDTDFARFNEIGWTDPISG